MFSILPPNMLDVCGEIYSINLNIRASIQGCDYCDEKKDMTIRVINVGVQIKVHDTPLFVVLIDCLWL